MLNITSVRAALAQHNTVFFDAELNPVEPTVDQWFCEFDVYDQADGQEFVRDEAFVQYIGNGLVVPEGDDEEEREPGGLILIRQGH